MANNMKNQTAVAKPDRYASVRELYDWIYCLLFALIVCVILFAFVFHVIDVVVFKKNEYDPNKALVKRVIATEGQEINMDFANGIVYIDGEAIAEPYINELTYNKLDFIGPKTVPEGCVFVMGDNRNASVDSRKSEIGMLDTRLILGRAYAVIYPLSVLRVIK